MLCTAGLISNVLLLSFSVMAWDRVRVKKVFLLYVGFKTLGV